jgi:hypothetical protein
MGVCVAGIAVIAGAAVTEVGAVAPVTAGAAVSTGTGVVAEEDVAASVGISVINPGVTLTAVRVAMICAARLVRVSDNGSAEGTPAC